MFAATDPDSGKTMMTTVKAEHMMDEPMGMEEEMERQIVDSQMNSMEDAMSNPPKKLFTWKNLRLQTAISGQQAFMGRLEEPLKVVESVMYSVSEKSNPKTTPQERLD